MRQYYEPRLLPRLLSGERFPAIRGLNELNRAQPDVQITEVRSENDTGDAVSVKVDIKSIRREYLREGNRITLESGANDLRLFRDGQLVAYAPNEPGEVVSGQLGERTIEFANIRLPHNGNSKVVFSAYCV